MKYKILETVWEKTTYKIEEDVPEVGVYLYCYENGLCVCDYLQNSIEECKIFALEEFGVPIENWKEKQN